jgi:Cu+-exporting ATPase
MSRTNGDGSGPDIDHDTRRPVACTVDLTPDGATTLYHAARMAELLEAPLVLLYAAPGPPILAPTPDGPWGLGPDARASIERTLGKFVSTHLSTPPTWTVQPMLGACPAQVVHWARALRVRALVVPASGSGGVGGLWWRGLADRLVSTAPCLLVVVPRGAVALGRSRTASSAGGERQIRDRDRPRRRPRPEHRREKVRDPVCGMHVEPDKAAGPSVYEGHTYLFCAPGCKERFDERPADFASVPGAGVPVG